MTATLRSAIATGRPSAVVATTMTDAERYALQTRELRLVFDPKERAQNYPGLTLQDRIGGRKLDCSQAAIIDDSGTPALDVPNVFLATLDYVVPESYFIALAVDIDTHADTGAFVYSSDTTSNRLFFGLLGSADLRIDHGGTDVIEHDGVTLTGKHVFWASYDATTGAAALGMDAITAVETATFSGPHKGYATTDFFGGATASGMDGRVYLAMIGDRYLGGDAQADIRASLLGWCAERNGVTLGA